MELNLENFSSFLKSQLSNHNPPSYEAYRKTKSEIKTTIENRGLRKENQGKILSISEL